LPNVLAVLPFMDPHFKSSSIDAVGELAATQGELFKFALPFGGEAWMAASRALSINLLTDPRFSKISPRPNADAPGSHRLYCHLLVTDPPEHTRLRRHLRAALAHWTTARIEALTRNIVLRRLDALDGADQRFDLVAHLTMPLALEIACAIVGIPPSDMAKVQNWNDMLLRSDIAGEGKSNEIANEIESYLMGLALSDAKLNNGAIGTLAEATSKGHLDEGEATALAYLLISAGVETTGHLLSSAVWLRVGDRKGWQAIAEDREAALRAVEECLRLNPSLELSTPRYAAEDIEMGTHIICQGDLIFAALGTANRDPLVFAGGSDFSRRQSGFPGHISFGRGPHSCPGATIARAASLVFLQQLAGRFPRMRLAEDYEPEWIPGLVMRGLRSLPVRVDSE
jgi:cytochrome P450